jgi:hypothetical protein
VEPFAPVLTVLKMRSNGAGDFLQQVCERGGLNRAPRPPPPSLTTHPPATRPQAVRFANTQLWGDLSATLIVHPETERQHKEAVEAAVAALRYGTVRAPRGSSWRPPSPSSTHWGCAPQPAAQPASDCHHCPAPRQRATACSADAEPTLA